MTNILVVYDSKYGQTERIAHTLADLARARGYDAIVLHANEASTTAHLEAADGVFVLSPIFLGKHMKTVRDFIARERALLAERPAAFVSVSGSAASRIEADRSAAATVAHDFVANLGWQPSVVECVGGAISYPKYNFLVRLVMRSISKKQGRATDTSRTHVLTDWKKVEETASQLFAVVEQSRRKAVTRSATAAEPHPS